MSRVKMKHRKSPEDVVLVQPHQVATMKSRGYTVVPDPVEEQEPSKKDTTSKPVTREVKTNG